MRIKKDLEQAEFITAARRIDGRLTWLLTVTAAGRAWLDSNKELLSEPLAPLATKRFGGPDADRLGAVFDDWARRAGAVRIEVEANDGAHGKHDRLVTFPDGTPLAGELITGEEQGG